MIKTDKKYPVFCLGCSLYDNPCNAPEEHRTCRLFAAYIIENEIKRKYPGITIQSFVQPNSLIPEIHIVLDKPMENIDKITDWNFG